MPKPSARRAYPCHRPARREARAAARERASGRGCARGRGDTETHGARALPRRPVQSLCPWRGRGRALSKGVAADRVPGPQRSLALSASLLGLTTAWCLVVLAEQIRTLWILWILNSSIVLMRRLYKLLARHCGSLCGGGVPSSHPSLGLSVFFLSFLHWARDWRALALTYTTGSFDA